MRKADNRKKTVKRVAAATIGVLLLILAGIILWPFLFPIKVTNSSLPYKYTIHGTYIEINRYTGSEEEVVIPDKICFRPVKVLGENEPEPYAKEGAFEECSTIKTVYIPDSIQYMASDCFANCVNLEEVRLSPNLYSILSVAFIDCKSLKIIDIPEGINIIGPYAFARCHQLEEVTLPQSLKKIYGNAFKDCENLQSVEIPEGVERIDGSAFFGTAWEQTWGKGAVVAGKNCLLRYSGEEETIEVPEGVEYIGTGALYECNQMKVLILPESVKECDYYIVNDQETFQYLVVKNPEMKFPDGIPIRTGHQDITIIGEKGSTAEAYAEGMGYEFSESLPGE